MKVDRPPEDEYERKPWPFVRTLIHFDVTESTNDVAKQLAREDRHDLPLAVWADQQTAGRGRGHNSWWSDAGSLMFSLLIDPRMHGLSAEHEPKLALAAAVGVINTLLVECHVCAGVRWPNDIELDGRKLGGTLPERVETATGTRLVVGIGLNVSTQLNDAPADVRSMAVSLRELMPATSATPDHAVILCSISGSLWTSIDRLARDDRALASEWESFDCLLNQPVRVDTGPRVVSGIGRGIDADGALRVETGGQILRFFGGRVLRS